jgi:hypothetical protein
LADGLLVYYGIGASECLESFVGLGIALATEYGLYTFGYNVPHISQVTVDGGAVEEEFAKTFECTTKCNE